MHTDAVCAAKGQRRTPMPADKGVEIPAFSGPLQFGGRRVHTTMVRHERVIALLGHDPLSIVTIQRHELPVSKPILGKTMPQSREGTPGEPANGHGRPVLAQQMRNALAQRGFMVACKDDQQPAATIGAGGPVTLRHGPTGKARGPSPR